MDESSLQTLWQEQPIDREVPSALARNLTLVRAPLGADLARPTMHFQDDVAPKKRRPVLLAFAALAACVAAGLVYSAATRPPDLGLVIGVPRSPKARPPPTVEETIATALIECRTWSSTDSGMADWGRALSSCNRVLDLEPLHGEAQQLVQRIPVLKSCEEDLRAGMEKLAQGRSEEALMHFTRLHAGCENYVLRAISSSREALVEVKKETAKECQAYAKRAQWEFAYPRCLTYARFACQALDPNEVSHLDSKPSDPVFATFFRVRSKLAAAPEWKCPDWPVFRAARAPGDPSKVALEDFSRRFTEPELNAALAAYFKGDFETALMGPERVLASMRKAEQHAKAKELRLDLESTINLYVNGNALLTLQSKPEEAAALYRQVLELDARLVLGDSTLTEVERKAALSKRESFIRKNVVRLMGSQTYGTGRDLADRRDFRGACRMWKLGYSFTHSNIDLLKALTNVCTKRAQDVVNEAATCEQLKAGLDFAVDGDGLKEELEELMKTCR